jgi:tetratricopeptide (TPR) repeat protein
MPLDPYVSCPCGSGKKFKWCCAPFYPQVEKAFGQDRVNQHEAALQTIRELTQSHADQPAVWGYFAQFLYNSAGLQQAEEEQAKMVEQAEEALSTALKLNPNFGMAHFLRGMFRLNEGEIIGALILFRKAAEAYDPEATDQLAHVHELIFRYELMMNRPVAGRAALERCVHFLPGDPEVKEQFDALFGSESRLPACARKAYSFRPTAKPVSTEAATGKLSDARKAFEKLTQLTPDDPAVWFNLALVLAWIGEQPKAVDALLKSVELETDDRRAEEAAALSEVLRCGQGMENDADYLEHGFAFPIRDPQAVMTWLQGMAEAGRLLGIQQNPEAQAMSAMIVDELPSLLSVGGTTMAKVVAKMSIAQGFIRFWHPDKATVANVADEFRTRVNLAVQEPQETTTPVNFGDVALEAIAYPTQTSNIEQAEEKLRDRAKNFFEETWIHRTRKSLAGNTPIDAVGSTLMRKRAFGAVKFMEDCYVSLAPQKKVGEAVVPIPLYDFDQVRHKLGLEYVSAPPPNVVVPAEPAAPAQASGGRESPDSSKKRDIASMSAAELASFDVAAATVDQLEQAMRAALKLDARELAVAFAQAGVLKPFDPAKPDRYPLYATAITGASAEGDVAKAIQTTIDGEKYDAEHNGGGRAIEFGLKRAQLHVKAKDVDGAVAAFDALIAKQPGEGKFYTTAAEEMLRLKNGPKALYFAEKGLAKARETGNRDLEGHCLELQSAAKRG